MIRPDSSDLDWNRLFETAAGQADEHEELVVARLWSEQAGVVSHQSQIHAAP
jgi:hypothetical protein